MPNSLQCVAPVCQLICIGLAVGFDQPFMMNYASTPYLVTLTRLRIRATQGNSPVLRLMFKIVVLREIQDMGEVLEHFLGQTAKATQLAFFYLAKVLRQF
jgi:hypothetical protein